MENKSELSAWRERALAFETSLNAVVVGLPEEIRALTIAIFSRGHVLLEGDVGVGKTTLLRAAAHLLGGGYQRIEGAIDLMPSDFLYNAYINEKGQAAVKPGPLLQHDEALAVFFFNEINRARPQAHALFLRLMAERSVNAFNREYHFPHLTVFADRNRLEREETFEIPAAARDRFLMEIPIKAPGDKNLQRALMFDTRFYDVDALVSQQSSGLTPYDQLNAVAEAIQTTVRAEMPLQNYAVDLWRVLKDPQAAGIQLPDVDMSRLLAGGASPRGMAMLMRSARTRAWLEGRDYLTPDDIRAVWPFVVTHRVFFNGAYALQHERLAPLLLQAVLDKVSAP